jgi:integrase/recombinase XerD
MRAIEISRLKWNMIVSPTGQLGESIHLTNDASKGKSGGRIIPIHKSLKVLLDDLFEAEKLKRGFDVKTSNVITTERGTNTSSQVIVDMFGKWYRQLGFVGCSSHSGRRTFITDLSKKVSLVGASLREVQILAGHSNLQTTQRYIDSDKDSHRKLVNLI